MHKQYSSDLEEAVGLFTQCMKLKVRVMAAIPLSLAAMYLNGPRAAEMWNKGEFYDLSTGLGLFQASANTLGALMACGFGLAKAHEYERLSSKLEEEIAKRQARGEVFTKEDYLTKHL